MLVILTLLLALPSLAFVARTTINKPQLNQPTSAYRPLLEQGVVLYHALATSRIEDIAEVRQLSESAANWEDHVHKILIDAGLMTNTSGE